MMTFFNMRSLAWWEYGLIFLILFLQGLRFWDLGNAPMGFYVDEAAGASHVMCLQQVGESFGGKTWDLFFASLGGGYTTAVYAYVQSLWTGLVGTSIEGFRSFSAFMGVLSVIGVFVLTSFLSNRRAGLLAAFFLSVSPWFFLANRIAWDPPMVLPFIIWGMVFFVVYKDKWWGSLLSGLLFVLAVLSYPPTKVQIVLLLPALFLLVYGWDIRRAIKEQWIGIVVLVLGAAWVVSFYAAHPEALARTKLLSIFADVYWEFFRNPHASKTIESVSLLFLQNIQSFFTPDFLWWKGDPNVRHSSGFMGMWTGFETLGVFASLLLLGLKTHWVSVSQKKVLLFCIAGYLFGIIPAALTWESNPHSLRAIGALPFLAMGSAVAVDIIIAQWGHNLLVRIFLFVSLLASAGVSLLFFMDFFTEYPRRSFGAFETPVIASIDQGNIAEWKKQVEERKYEPLTKAYYYMQYMKKTCQEAKGL